MASRLGDEGIALLAKLVDLDEERLSAPIKEPWRHYRSIAIPKATGAPRRIDVPSLALKTVQRAILRQILDPVPRHPASHCVRGRSVITNARAHVGNRYVSKFDLRNAFPSVTYLAVRGALRRAGLPDVIVAPVTHLCTYKGRLPQGPPTSPAILDLVLHRLDVKLTAEAERHGIRYSRYVDDLCVSANRPVRFFGKTVHDVTARNGFHLAQEKTRHWGPGRRATITGILLARTPSLRLDYVSGVRYAIAEYEENPGRLTPGEVASLRGHASWIRQVHPRIGARLLARVDAVVR